MQTKQPQTTHWTNGQVTSKHARPPSAAARLRRRLTIGAEALIHEADTRRSSSFLLILFLAALAIAGATAANGALGTLAGAVTDAQGKPVTGATVTIQTSDGLQPHATHTDADGRFQFSRYRPGQYDLRAYAGGVFSDWSKRILIRTGKTTEITLRIHTHDAEPDSHPSH